MLLYLLESETQVSPLVSILAGGGGVEISWIWVPMQVRWQLSSGFGQLGAEAGAELLPVPGWNGSFGRGGTMWPGGLWGKLGRGKPAAWPPTPLVHHWCLCLIFPTSCLIHPLLSLLSAQLPLPLVTFSSGSGWKRSLLLFGKWLQVGSGCWRAGTDIGQGAGGLVAGVCWWGAGPGEGQGLSPPTATFPVTAVVWGEFKKIFL